MKKLTQILLSTVPAFFLAQGLAVAAPDVIEEDEMIVISENADKPAESTTSKVKSALSDTEITAKVKAKFIEEKLDEKDIAAFKVHVKTKKGVVYLSGKVTDKEQADNAVKVAKGIEGVKDVKSTIVVKPAKKAEKK
ncbi:BON domain-containing protein [Candidatus Berkiella aquae]|uniref:BON domain-containing protein n=1 Tax=Candidatus Berkiella aquae TaxID=295108 RepID=A0A0Q9YBC5_9GAMM|nr:BON domain-containing protein [Candidatus Berkiella aquae]MCS5710610.1 BON domain-containing protein [Candidatus Berkiella aquae]